WTPRQLSIRGFETTTLGEVTPRWMPVVPPYNPAAASVVSGDAQVRETARTPFSWSGQVAAKTASRLQMAIAYYPGWTVRVDGRPFEITPSPSGLMELPLPAGEHQVAVSWGRSGARRLGETISLVALAVLAIGVWRFRPTTN